MPTRKETASSRRRSRSCMHEPHVSPDDDRHLAHAGPHGGGTGALRPAAPARRAAARRPRGPGRSRRRQQRERQGAAAAAPTRRGMTPPRTGADGQPGAVGRARAGQPGGHVGPRVRPVDRVDVPGLQRPRVEGPRDPVDRPGEREHEHRRRPRHRSSPACRQQAGERQHRPVADRVGQPAGGQLEQQGHRAVDGDGDADVGRGEPARRGEQHRHRDGDADGQPAQRRQRDEPPAGLVGRQDGVHSG